MTKSLLRFYWDCGRQGHIEGMFVATNEQVEEACGKEVYFGEVLGKHSEIFGVLRRDDFHLLTDDPDFVRNFEKFKCESGFNPLNYLE